MRDSLGWLKRPVVVNYGVPVLPEKWRLHRTTLEAHQPFRHFRYRTTGADGKEAERIFDPFFTTKPEGMGLGLPIKFGSGQKRLVTNRGRGESYAA